MSPTFTCDFSEGSNQLLVRASTSRALQEVDLIMDKYMMNRITYPRLGGGGCAGSRQPGLLSSAAATATSSSSGQPLIRVNCISTLNPSRPIIRQVPPLQRPPRPWSTIPTPVCPSQPAPLSVDCHCMHAPNSLTHALTFYSSLQDLGSNLVRLRFRTRPVARNPHASDR